jgi:hypothetical protein
VADNILRPPTPNMQGRELVQWLQRVYDILNQYQTTPEPVPPEIPSSHNQLTDNGGTGSHAAISSHISAFAAHGRTSDLVGVTDTQVLVNKVINALNNTITNLRHGVEVDSPTAAHGVTTVVGAVETQTLTNKSIRGDLNTIRNLRHGIEVDDPAAGVHGVMGGVVGTLNLQILWDKILLRRVTSVSTDYTVTLLDDVISVDNGAVTITIPAVTSEYLGKTYTIDNKSTANITLAATALIEGETTQTMPTDSSMTVCYNGTTWRII